MYTNIPTVERVRLAVRVPQHGEPHYIIDGPGFDLVDCASGFSPASPSIDH